MRTIGKILDITSEVLKVLGGICLAAMMFLTCADVIGRFFNYPIFGTVEIVGFMATITIAAALPYAQKTDSHVGVELLVRLLSRKTQTIIDIITLSVSLVLFGISTCQLVLYGNDMLETGEVSMNLEFPTYLIIYIISFCMLVFTLTICQEITKKINQLRKK